MADTAVNSADAEPHTTTAAHDNIAAPEIANLQQHGPRDTEAVGGNARPVGWMYKSRKIGPLTLPWYASPTAQIAIVGFICFLCPGMFNAISGIGGGGQVNANAANQANTALYATFSIVAFFAGSIVNRVGIKLTLSFGGLGYCIYVASFLCYNHTANDGFIVFAGALLGVCAGLLWAAEGAIMLSYPAEKDKGKSIALFWVIFNFGGVVGSLVYAPLNCCRLRLTRSRFPSDRISITTRVPSRMAHMLASWFS